ncbi:MAG: M23 family metallopeptidase, partial [Candidatus Dojkabacteria bacterium]
SKGYPVYSACSGMVIRVYQPNEEIEILCDVIHKDYKDIVPSLTVKTLYAHLGDAVTKERYHSLRVGQRVKRGELIGYQGNVSSIAPVNRVTHLHFGIYDLTLPGRPTVNPEPYIGVSTTKVGQKFSTAKNN